MKKVKVVLALIVVGFVGLVFYQNKDFFLASTALHLDLGFIKIGIPGIPNIAYQLFFGISGFLVAGILGILSFLKSRKAIKALNATIISHVETISNMKHGPETKDDAVEADPDEKIDTKKPVEEDKIADKEASKEKEA